MHILIIYDHFYPGYKAGGPIQSLMNLSALLRLEHKVSILTSAYDLNTAKPYDQIAISKWNKVMLPGADAALDVYYAKHKELTRSKLRSLISELSPEIVYLNGIFSLRYFLMVLFAIKRSNKKIKTVICPRGMLQPGALSGKAMKKKLYLSYLRLSGMVNKVRWHATSDFERDDIISNFPLHGEIFVAPNIPKKPYDEQVGLSKIPGKLKLIHLSLIAEMKNILFLLELMTKTGNEIELDIYGPVKDQFYWEKCLKLIDASSTVNYKGDLLPAKVQETLTKYHALILLTKGENFGHAIYESFSVGRPVITSVYTPWNELAEKKAGVNVDIHNMEDCLSKIKTFVEMDQPEYDHYCINALALAKDHYENMHAAEKYRELFKV